MVKLTQVGGGESSGEEGREKFMKVRRITERRERERERERETETETETETERREGKRRDELRFLRRLEEQ